MGQQSLILDMKIEQVPEMYPRLETLAEQLFPSQKRAILETYNLIYQSRGHFEDNRNLKENCVYDAAGQSLTPTVVYAVRKAVVRGVRQGLDATGELREALLQDIERLGKNGLDWAYQEKTPLVDLMDAATAEGRTIYVDGFHKHSKDIRFRNALGDLEHEAESKPAAIIFIGVNMDNPRHRDHFSNGFLGNGEYIFGDETIIRQCIGRKIYDEVVWDEVMKLFRKDGALLLNDEAVIGGTNVMITKFDPAIVLTQKQQVDKIDPLSAMGFMSHVNTRHTTAISATHPSILEGTISMTLSAEKGLARIGYEGHIIFSTRSDEDEHAEEFREQLRQRYQKA
jgi:hypothetical protein